MKRDTPLKRRTALGPGAKSLERRSTFPSPSQDMARTGRLKKGRGMAASERQRVKTAGRACVACGESPCDPAHVIPRSMGGCDDGLCVVPLCRSCHRAYDTGEMDLLPHLEPHRQAELGHAVTHVGLIATLERVTNTRWRPVDSPARQPALRAGCAPPRVASCPKPSLR